MRGWTAAAPPRFRLWQGRTPGRFTGANRACRGRGERFAAPEAATSRRQAYEFPRSLPFNQWALAGEWTIAAEHVVPHRAGGSIAFRYQARDAHLVLAPGPGGPTPFRVSLDGRPPGPAHGVDVDEDGAGLLTAGRLYHLARECGPVRERTLEITFAGPGARAYAFTFG